MLIDQQEQLLKILQEKKLLVADQVADIKLKVAAAKTELPDFLLNNKLVNEEQLTEAKAVLYNLPYFAYTDEVIPKEVLNFLPEEIARTYNIVCLAKENKTLKIGLVEPNLKAMEAVNFLALDEKLNVQYYLLSASSWQKIFKQYQKIEEEISSALEIKAKEDSDDVVAIKSEDAAMVDEEDINSAPVSRIVSVIIRHAVEARASDIHIEPYDKESRVRYRIDGILHTSLTLPKSIHNAIIARIKVMSKLKLDETRVPQDGRVRLLVNGRAVDFRISTLPLANHEKVVMRILDTAKGAPALSDLGFNSNSLRAINAAIKKTSGIILVTGPTGSGKTTTLYSLLNILNQEGVNISTLEDPIEYEIKGVNQSQVRPKVGFTFANGLRSLLRQDPNIIMVGEIRDEETAELSIHASLTGHLVISTLHTNDALGAVFRLLDMKIERFLLASTLKTVVAQRLARRLCDKCRQVVTLPESELAAMSAALKDVPAHILKTELPDLQDLNNLSNYTFYRSVGCSHCENTGFTGRVAISEVIDINDQLKEMINRGDKNLNIDAVKASQDFISINQDGIIKVLKGITTMEEILRVIES
ncbi:MAG: Type II secretion system protein E [Parcubacteria group bacterium ADurb.Bin115]|nr:MAG: Type II secretion system protein E [Parcubacteria group bacterium ADurb.Bin115]HQQ38569.1 ATPase, T2SS/T4P/T4SS family [bacterium]